jgi:murein DD-endopeptidase MepM/ murein hydrolase activator NlpD
VDHTLPRKSRTTRRRVTWLTAVVATATLASGPAFLPAQADDLKDKKKQAHQQVQAAKGDLEDSSAALSGATRKLQAAQAGLGSAQAKLARTQGELTTAQAFDVQMQAKLVKAQAALDQAVQDVSDGEARVKDQTDALGRLAVASYSYGDPNLVRISVLLRGTDPGDIQVQLATLDNMLGDEASMLDELKATQALLIVQRKKVKSAEADVAEQRQVAAVNLARKKVLEQQAESARAKVVALVAARKTAARAAAAARASDARKLAASKRKEARIQKQILAAAKHQHNGGSYHGDSGGFLYKPVPGYITSPYGYRIHPIYGYYSLHDGDDFHAPCGTPERAGAAGRVISEYYSDVWGNRLYLDVGKVNGHHMTLIYNHISSYKAHTGDRVGRGDVVAYAGTTGWSTGCHLHFTVLIDGTAVDPQKYM